MRLISLELESKLREKRLWPQSWIAWAALYALALDLFAFAAQWLTRRASASAAASLAGWITFLGLLTIVLLAIAGYRWLHWQLMWRLRNRLIVTYIFIGVIPVFLLVAIALATLYLFVWQFAGFVVTSDIEAHLRSMEAANRAIAHHLAAQVADGGNLNAEVLDRTRPHRPEWARRQVCAWRRLQPQPYCSGPKEAAGFSFPLFVTGDFRGIVSDHGKLYLRAATVRAAQPDSLSLRVISSEPLDEDFVGQIAGGLGRIAIYVTADPTSSSTAPAQPGPSKLFLPFDDGTQREQTFSAGTIPPASGAFDRQIGLAIPLPVVNWARGEQRRDGAYAEVETRPSVLYGRLFAALGDFAGGLEYILLSIVFVFALIEMFSLYVGRKLTNSITSAVDQLYEATRHVNRADFSHRITVQSTDQLAALGNSFNSMTTSIEKLVEEQKEKQRMDGELAIAQEVQAQLYPTSVAQLDTLEVHGFCRPARTVSGDYYDFLPLNSNRLMLAVGDISGKGISAALLMATVHSALHAYSVEDRSALRGPAAPLAAGGAQPAPVAESSGREVSPAALLTLLNHQLYENTPAAKYATLFLGIYDGATRRLTYTNGGHLPPVLISEDGPARRLDCGGTVVGLFDNLSYAEATVQLHPGDVLAAYSDGVTEPENEYGEFGEERLIQLVRANRHLPLARITEIVMAAVADWIGDKEQPDDVTLVLARAR